MLSDSGINMNLSPVLDIYNNSKSKALDKRCFYGDENQVTKLGAEYVKELDNNKIVSVIKHFPGHGASKFDSHFIIPYIFNNQDVLDKHIKPFEVLLKNAPAVMVGHLLIRGLTGLVPVSMNDKFITKYIREDNKYDGIVMTDEINMLKRHPLYRFSYLKGILNADNDIILVKLKDLNEGYTIINKYKSMLDNNKQCVLELDKHVERIIDIKKKYDISDDDKVSGVDIEKLNKRIDKINDIVNNL